MSQPPADLRSTKHKHKEPPTPKGRNTKAQILEAGRAVLEERGYFETSVGEITRRSGIALGNFYRYFENKDVLCLQLLELLITEIESATSGSWAKDDTMENLRRSSLRYLTAYYKNRKLIAAMLQMAGAVPACAALWWTLRRRSYDRIKHYLVSSRIARQIDPDLTATALGSMFEQFAYYWYVEGKKSRKAVPKLEQAADVLSLIWYRAVYEDRPPPK